ncbi:MAG TPA: fasciclin domain-containing protein [Paludibacter sp.]|nr:fasciclin domain-containing protein [Paludibacter sp.]
MKNCIGNAMCRRLKFAIILAIGIFGLASCADENPYDEKEPEWLGGSIYEYLKSDGHFTNFVHLIDDLNYAEVLKLTGSKTLFVANDSAFNEFYKNNEWGVTGYDQLTESQKKQLLNYSLINNTFTSDMFSNYNSGDLLYEGTAMRRQTALENIDMVHFVKPEDVPDGERWAYYKDKGIYVINDFTVFSSNKTIPMAFISQYLMDSYGITDEDFSYLTNGATRSKNDWYLFDNKVVKRDVRCKNGYIHVLNKVLVPRMNMAEYINKCPDTKIFSRLLERFSVPVYDATSTMAYKLLHPEFTDSIFSKSYFSSGAQSFTYMINGVAQPNLPYNPGWNSYRSITGALQADMACIFVPTDKAMNDYLNGDGVGAILKDRFGSWENMPTNIILPFLKRHMRPSLIESVPSKFSKMVDGENYPMPVQKGHIDIGKSYMGVNGQVFVSNSVYPPVDYISVYSPVLMSANSKIMNWAINISQSSVDGTMFAFYKLYLNSLVSKYSLFVPTDEFFDKYIDPIAYGQNVQGVLKYVFDTKSSSVKAYVYRYDKINDVITDDTPIDSITSPDFLKNRLWDLLDSHIVIGDVDDRSIATGSKGSKYFITKANDIIRVEGSGSSLTVQGGGDIANGNTISTTRFFNQSLSGGNGKTYFLNHPIQPALRSVYKVLSETPEFSKFYELLSGVPQGSIFVDQGVDKRVKFFSTFRYTIYVPTNDAVQLAIDTHRIKTWDEINAITNTTEKNAEIDKMVRMLKYHFQDNAVFADQVLDQRFQSSTIKTDNVSTYWNTAKTKYFKIGVKGDGSTLHLTADTWDGAAHCTANVVDDNNFRNIIVKDYIFSNLPSKYKNVDKTGSTSGANFNTSTITSSASAVIHQIDNVLTIE